mmetsp:Transcript_19202/g.61090  ORF Transcript_19202/g.61090 Transcript_19202/m.61090 type:complete len:305 (-) Transcript_19202:364-1278(-)
MVLRRGLVGDRPPPQQLVQLSLRARQLRARGSSRGGVCVSAARGGGDEVARAAELLLEHGLDAVPRLRVGCRCAGWGGGGSRAGRWGRHGHWCRWPCWSRLSRCCGRGRRCGRQWGRQRARVDRFPRTDRLACSVQRLAAVPQLDRPRDVACGLGGLAGRLVGIEAVDELLHQLRGRCWSWSWSWSWCGSRGGHHFLPWLCTHDRDHPALRADPVFRSRRWRWRWGRRRCRPTCSPRQLCLQRLETTHVAQSSIAIAFALSGQRGRLGGVPSRTERSHPPVTVSALLGQILPTIMLRFMRKRLV